jgi:hypothetical protein
VTAGFSVLKLAFKLRTTSNKLALDRRSICRRFRIDHDQMATVGLYLAAYTSKHHNAKLKEKMRSESAALCRR